MELLFSLLLSLLSCADLPDTEIDMCVSNTLIQIEYVLDTLD